MRMEIMRRAISSSVPRPNRASNRRRIAAGSDPFGALLPGQDESFCAEHSDEAFDGFHAFFLVENDGFWEETS